MDVNGEGLSSEATSSAREGWDLGDYPTPIARSRQTTILRAGDYVLVHEGFLPGLVSAYQKEAQRSTWNIERSKAQEYPD